MDDSWYCPASEKNQPYSNTPGIGPEPFKAKVQSLRSLCNWSGGINHVEQSIMTAYYELITSAKKFIYIENQFFTTIIHSGDAVSEVKNTIGQAIVDRIVQAHIEKTDFKIYIVIPFLPEGLGSIYDIKDGFNTVKTIMHFQFLGMNKDSGTGNSIFSYLEKEGIDPNNYIHFATPRQYQYATKNHPVTELIYVHSKLLIVDDLYTIIGSTNCNDRSQLGERDSEYCLKFTCNEFAKSLRLEIYGARFSVSGLLI